MQTNWRRARIALVAVFVGFVHLTIAIPTFAQSSDPLTDPAAPDAGDTELYLPALANGDPPVEPLDSDAAGAEQGSTAAENNETPAPGAGAAELYLPPTANGDSPVPAGIGEAAEVPAPAASDIDVPPTALADANGTLAIAPAAFVPRSLIQQGQQGIPNGATRLEETGKAVAAGDFNGDGYVDMVAGVPGEGPYWGGALLLLYGSQYGLGVKSTDMIHPESAGLPPEAQGLHELGWSVASGDFNGDGYADVAAGDPRFTGNLGDVSGEPIGAVLVD